MQNASATTLASTLPGNHLVQEITPDSTDPQTQRLLCQKFQPGSLNYRGLVLKYHNIIDTQTGKKLGTALPNVPTHPVTIHTPYIVERLTGLCLQLGFLTLETLDNSIRSGGFYEQQHPEQEQPFTPSPELEETLHTLLKLEAITNLEQRVHSLAALSDEEWKRYIILHKARNLVLVELLGELPGLISDTLMRTWFVVTLNARLPAWVVEAGERRSQGFLYSQLKNPKRFNQT